MIFSVQEFNQRKELLSKELQVLETQLAIARPDLYRQINDREPSQRPPTKPTPSGGNYFEAPAGPRPFTRLGDFLQATIRSSLPQAKIDPRLHEIGAVLETRATGMSEGIASEGGFLLQDNFSSELLMTVWEDPGVLARIRKFSLANGNNLKIPRIIETSRQNGSRFGGVQMYWKAEGASKASSATKPDLGLVDLEVKKVIGLTYLTDELIQDVSALESYVKLVFNSEMQFKLLEAVLRGTGAGQPLGIFNSSAMVTVLKETGQTSKEILADNIVKMYSRWLGDPSRGCWIVNRSVFSALYTLGITVGVGGSPLFVPAGGISATPFNSLLGMPVFILEQASALGYVGDISLCDFSYYLAIDRGPMQQASSIHVSFLTDETALRFVYRFDGQPWLNSPITPWDGSNDSLSPFVALETRA